MWHGCRKRSTHAVRVLVEQASTRMRDARVDRRGATGYHGRTGTGWARARRTINDQVLGRVGDGRGRERRGEGRSSQRGGGAPSLVDHARAPLSARAQSLQLSAARLVLGRASRACLSAECLFRRRRRAPRRRSARRRWRRCRSARRRCQLPRAMTSSRQAASAAASPGPTGARGGDSPPLSATPTAAPADVAAAAAVLAAAAVPRSFFFSAQPNRHSQTSA